MRGRAEGGREGINGREATRGQHADGVFKISGKQTVGRCHSYATLTTLFLTLRRPLLCCSPILYKLGELPPPLGLAAIEQREAAAPCDGNGLLLHQMRLEANVMRLEEGPATDEAEFPHVMAASESTESLGGSSIASEPVCCARPLDGGDTSPCVLVSEPSETIALTPAASVPEQELIDRIVAGNQQHGGDDPAATPSLAVPAPAAAPAQAGLPDEAAETVTSNQAAAAAALAGATGGLFSFPCPESEQQMPSRLVAASRPFHLEAAGAAVAADTPPPEPVAGVTAEAEAMSTEAIVAASAVAAESMSLKRIVRDARGRLSLDQIGQSFAAASSVEELAAFAAPHLYKGAMTDSRSLSSDALHGVPASPPAVYVPASPPAGSPKGLHGVPASPDTSLDGLQSSLLTLSDGLQSTPSSPGQQEGAVAMGPTLQLLPPRLQEGDFEQLPRDFDHQFAGFDGQFSGFDKHFAGFDGQLAAGGIISPKQLTPLRLDGDTPALSLDEWLLSTAVAAEAPEAAPSLLAVQAVTEPQLAKAAAAATAVVAEPWEVITGSPLAEGVAAAAALAAAAVAEPWGVIMEPPVAAKAGTAATAVVAGAGAFAGEFTGGLDGAEAATAAAAADQSYSRPLLCEPEVERANDR